MRKVTLLILLAVGASAQSLVPTVFGPLSCGLRLLSPGLVQTYCFDLPASSPITTICNAVHQVRPTAPGASLPALASYSCFATDPAGGNNYEISWLVWMPQVALPPGSNGVVVYQIATAIVPCALDPAKGVCVQTAGSTAATTYQTGTLDPLAVAIGRPAGVLFPGRVRGYNRFVARSVQTGKGGGGKWLRRLSSTLPG